VNADVSLTVSMAALDEVLATVTILQLLCIISMEMVGSDCRTSSLYVITQNTDW